MRILSRLSVLLIFGWLSFSADAQTITTAATARKDPNALQVLGQMSAVTGWSRAITPTDVLATATLTLGSADGAPVMKSITYKARGRTQFRWEYSDAPGKTTVADLGAGLAFGPNGIPVPAQAAQPWQFPFLGRFLEFADPVVQVEYLGMETLSEPAYKLRFHRVPSSADRNPDEVEAGSTMTLWVSSTSFLPLQVQYLAQCFTNRLAFIQHIRKYSNYRSVQGVQVPFHQEEWADGELIYTLDLTNVSFNVGLSPGDFSISSLAGGRK